MIAARRNFFLIRVSSSHDFMHTYVYMHMKNGLVFTCVYLYILETKDHFYCNTGETKGSRLKNLP